MAILPTYFLHWLIFSSFSILANAADVLIRAPDVLEVTDLDITCSVSHPSSLKKVYSFTLLRNNSNTSPTLTSIAYMDRDVSKLESDVKNRAELSGTIATPSTAHLKLSIPAADTKCSDAVFYECKAVVLTTANKTETYTKNKTVKVEVKPASTDDIRVSPSRLTDDGKYAIEPGTEVTLNCTGDVGNPAKLHRWCIKGGKTFTKIESQGIKGGFTVAHINQEVRLVFQQDTCDYRRTSQLRYNFTTRDTTIWFLCEDDSNEFCGSGVSTKQIELIKAKEESYLGIIFGVVLGIALVTMFVVFFWLIIFFNRRSVGNEVNENQGNCYQLLRNMDNRNVNMSPGDNDVDRNHGNMDNAKVNQSPDDNEVNGSHDDHTHPPGKTDKPSVPQSSEMIDREN